MSNPGLGPWQGLGLVIANMVGAGVFISSGFMAQSQTPTAILLAWCVGLVLALCGAVAYGELARLVPGSGGEYRYLSVLMHPAAGNLAGWTSLLVGFSAPIALDAIAAGAFLRAIIPGLSPRLVGAFLIIALTLLHARNWKSSLRSQGFLVALKVLAVLGFVTVAFIFGSTSWPQWVPPTPASAPAWEFVASLGYIAFAFSGWNAAVYVAGEFAKPERSVAWAMTRGCLLVGGAYLVLNYLFLANLTPAEGAVVFRYDNFSNLQGQVSAVTLGHAVVVRLLGERFGVLMSAVMVVLFASAMSAMLLVGSRVYAAMASRGDLPSRFATSRGGVPQPALILQGLLALLLLSLQDARAMLANIGAVVFFFTALTAGSLFFVLYRARKDATLAPRTWPLVAAGVTVIASLFTLGATIRASPTLILWVVLVIIVSVVARKLAHREVAR